MIVYDKEQKEIVIPNGIGNVNIIINQGCDDDKPTPPQDGWGMTGIFNNWGESPDIPFKEDGEWEGRPYKVIRNFGATGGEFKIRRNNAWTDSYTASFHNEPQFAQLLKNDFSMSIDDGIWDIYLFFGNDGEPNEMLILRPGTNLSTIQYEYTLTISTDKENAIIEIADSYRGMTDRYCGDVTVTMKYGCIYYVNVYMEGYEDISDEITCHNNEERNYTLTKKKYNTIADIYGSPSNSIVTFKGLVALSFDYAKLNKGDYILFTDHTGSIILKKCQKPLKVGDECLVTATLRRYNDSYIPTLFYYDGSSVEVLSSNNYVVMPTDAVELTNLNDLYIPNENGYAEMKYLYADGTVVKAPSDNFMRIETEATKPDNITLRGDLSDWEGKLAEGDNVRVYMFPETNPNTFWVTDIIELGEEDGSYNKGYEQGKADVVTKARVLDVTENGVYKSKFSDPIVPEIVTGVYDNGTNFYSYAELNRKVFNTKIAATIDSRLEFWYKGDNTALGFGDNVIIGAGNNDNSDCFQVRYYEGFNGWVKISVGNSTIDINNWNDTVWHHLIISKAEGLWVDGEKKGDFTASNTINGKFYINGIGYDTARNANGTFGMIKIDDVVIIPTANGFQNVNTGELLQVVKDGNYTFTENLPIYGEGELYKTINVNVPDLNGSYDEGYAEGERVGYGQGKTDGINEQKGKLESINITENGTYRKEDGYNEVVVNVPDLNGSYDEGYNQGQADVAANARVLDVTENGVYRSKFSDPIFPDTYTVTGVYADGTKFYNYAELNGKIFNTKIAGSVDSRLEFWYKGDNTANGAWNIIIGSGNNDNSDCFRVRYYVFYNTWVQISIGNSTKDIQDWDDTVWHHLIVSKAEGLWIDGEKKGDFTPTNTINGEFFINGIGHSADGSGSANGTFGMIKIDDTIIIPTADGFLNTNTGELLEVVNDGGYTYTEIPPIYPEGELYKTINVNVIPKINVKEAGLKFAYSTFAKLPEYLDFNGITDMSNMFENSRLQTIPLIDTSNVTNMSRMFYLCGSLKTIPLIDTSNVTNMYAIFYGCENLQIISQIDTSNVTDMTNMFGSCSSLVSLPALDVRSLNMGQYTGIFGYSDLPKLTDLGGFLNLKSSLESDNNLKRLPNLTYQSCINVLNGLYDFTGNGETPNSNQGRLKVAQSFIDKVGDEISIGVAKGWSITA